MDTTVYLLIRRGCCLPSLLLLSSGAGPSIAKPQSMMARTPRTTKSTSPLALRLSNISSRWSRATVSGTLVLSNLVPIGPPAHQPLPAPGPATKQSWTGQDGPRSSGQTKNQPARSGQGCCQPRRLVIRTCRPNRETCRCTAEVQSAGACLSLACLAHDS